ncbi:hypothetical protein [Halochromatium glycolicum]|uniref:Uncharacterized protein n=1 Tax=Halochromatium glycolicum TaxID=85075 RepID=A0AAJ0U1Z4_9GAMM|nr:hypothetical protein [Halochromatium glycolicum]MBK1703377.1 hypothetical protein [Halochromatium glycolicum]
MPLNLLAKPIIGRAECALYQAQQGLAFAAALALFDTLVAALLDLPIDTGPHDGLCWCIQRRALGITL